MTVPVFWLAKKGVTCARCRWDEWHVEDLINGLKAPGRWPKFEHRVVEELPATPFAVVCLPGHDHLEEVGWVNGQLNRINRLILFLGSDEDSCFPHHLLTHSSMDLWIMEPRVELEETYPDGTQFINCGSARATDGMYARDKTVDWFFAGQVNHERRQECAEALEAIGGGKVFTTDGFLQGMERTEYLDAMSEAKVVPCPSGIQSQDSFRLHEALELGCVPLADAYRPDGEGDGYWDLTMPRYPFPLVRRWSEVGTVMRKVLDTWPWSAIKCHSYWHGRRRQLAQTLRRQIESGVGNPGHDLTVVIPTSPIPSHPRLGVIDATIDSIRQRTDAEILVMCDGVRQEQRHRRADYYEYLRRLMLYCEKVPNITPLVFEEHLHQAEMLRRVLDEIDTEFVLFVEHDTPLVNEINLDHVIRMMQADSINLMRFHHEVAILDAHAHLMVDLHPASGYRRTMQWSQRPHVARTGWYRDITDRFFAPEARTMIEDVMFGVVEHDWITRGEAGWRDWRLAIYEPQGNIQRSTHTDGREGDPKFEDKYRYRYPGRTPPGAPLPRQGV